jgi:hypothetical protein
MSEIKLPNIPNHVERWPDGEVILVVRPENPHLAMTLTNVAVKRQSIKALQKASSGLLTFMGFLRRESDGTMHIVNDKGENPQPLQAGDAFISRHEISEMMKP